MGQKLTVIKEGADSGLTGRLGTWGWVVRVPGVEPPAQLGGAGQAFRAWRACLRAHRGQAGTVPAMATAGTPSNQ